MKANVGDHARGRRARPRNAGVVSIMLRWSRSLCPDGSPPIWLMIALVEFGARVDGVPKV